MPNRPADSIRVAVDGDLAIVHCSEPFTFAPGHRMRAACCLICRHAIGAEPATLIGVAALAGAACSCSRVTSDLYVMHTGHLPIDGAALKTALSIALFCEIAHDPD